MDQPRIEAASLAATVAAMPSPGRPERFARVAELDLDALYRDCATDVYAYVASLLRDRSAAEDVTALAFERAYRARRRHDPRRGSARAWLFGIARNAALDDLRRRRRMQQAPLDLEHEASDELVDETDETVRRVAVRDALCTLAPRDREVVLLKFHGGLTNAELAGVLRVSETNAATRLHRALTRLRQACLTGEQA